MRGDNRPKRAMRKRRDALAAVLAPRIAAGLPVPSGNALGRIMNVSNVTGNRWKRWIMAQARSDIGDLGSAHHGSAEA